MPNKPQGQYEIDWTNPLARGLKHFFLMDGFPVRDSVAGNQGTNHGATLDKDNIDFDGVSDYISLSSNDLFLDCSKKFSIITKLDIDSVPANYNGVMTPARSKDESTNASNLFISDVASYGPMSFVAIKPNTDTMVLHWDNTYFGLNPTGVHTWGITHNGGFTLNDFLLFKDNLQDTYGVPPGVGSVNGQLIGSYGAGAELDGRIHYIAIWEDRELSPTEYLEFTQNPYQILKEVRTIQGATYAALFSGGVVVIPDPDPLDIGLALGPTEYTQGAMYLGDTEIETMFLGGINITQQYVTDENGAYLIDENNNYITYGD